MVPLKGILLHELKKLHALTGFRQGCLQTLCMSVLKLIDELDLNGNAAAYRSAVKKEKMLPLSVFTSRTKP